MAQSDLSKKLTKTIKVADKLVSDVLKDVRKLNEVLRELRKADDEEKKGE